MRFHFLRLGAGTVLLASMLGAIALALAMRLYPGGTELDPHSHGHSFWFNFLCDLTGPRALNGLPNDRAASWARLGMASLALAVGAFWLILPGVLVGYRKSGLIIRLSGAISVVGLLAVPVADDSWHAVAIFTSVIPALVAGLTGLLAIIRQARDRWLIGAACATVTASLVGAILYARRVESDFHSCPPSLPVFQRLALMLMLVWMGTAALKILVPGSPRRMGGIGMGRRRSAAASSASLMIAPRITAAGDGDHDQAPGR